METAACVHTPKLGVSAPFIDNIVHGLEVRKDCMLCFSDCDQSPIPTPNIPPLDNFSFTIELLNIYTLETLVTIPCSGRELPIQVLVTNGYLGNAPMTPSLVISFRTLELFWRICLHKSSFSVEAFTKVVCDMYSVSVPSP